MGSVSSFKRGDYVGGMVEFELPLKWKTPAAWAVGVLREPMGLLNDHAHLEKRAANNAWELLHGWPWDKAAGEGAGAGWEGGGGGGVGEGSGWGVGGGGSGGGGEARGGEMWGGEGGVGGGRGGGVRMHSGVGNERMIADI